MSNELQQQANELLRGYIKNELSKLEDKHRLLFMKMYSHKDLNANIDHVVDSIHVDKLNWVVKQIENTNV